MIGKNSYMNCQYIPFRTKHACLNEKGNLLKQGRVADDKGTSIINIK